MLTICAMTRSGIRSRGVAVKNFHDSVDDLRNWYVRDLLRALCVVNVGFWDHFINLFISELLSELHD